MSDWDDLFTGAQARADQNMAVIRDNGQQWADFTRACTAFDDVLRSCGMSRAARISALVNTALAAGLTSGEG